MKNKFIRFLINDELVAIPLDNVIEVGIVTTVKPLVESPAHVVGIGTYKAKSIVVVDIVKTKKERVQVCIIQNGQNILALAVDRNIDQLFVESNQLNECKCENGLFLDVMKGVVKDHKVSFLLDCEKVFSLSGIPFFYNNYQPRKNIDYKKKRSLILAKINAEIYGLDVLHIKEVLINKKDFQKNVINHKNKLIPLVNILTMQERETLTVIIYKVGGFEFALVVDEILNFISIDDENLIKSELKNSAINPYLEGQFSYNEKRYYSLDIIKIMNNENVQNILKAHRMYHGNLIEDKSKKQDIRRLLLFKMGIHFALPILDVIEIQTYQNNQELNQEKGYLGTINSRENMAILVHGGVIYNLQSPERVFDKVVVINSSHGAIGLVVEEITDIMNIDMERCISMPKVLVTNLNEKFGNQIENVVYSDQIKFQERKENTIIILNAENVVKSIQKMVSIF